MSVALTLSIFSTTDRRRLAHASQFPKPPVLVALASPAPFIRSPCTGPIDACRARLRAIGQCLQEIGQAGVATLLEKPRHGVAPAPAAWLGWLIDRKNGWLQAMNRSDTSCEMTASFSTINEMSRSVPCP